MALHPVSSRKLRRYRAAERVCRRVRLNIARQATADWNAVCDLLVRWVSLAGKEAYREPAPKRRK